MAIPSKQIGWSQESNLLWEILKKTNQLGGSLSNALSPKYKSYIALLNANDLSNPIVLENTLGEDITWTSPSIGTYYGTLSNPIFTENKTIGFCYGGGDADDVYLGYLVKRNSDEEIQVIDPTGYSFESINIRLEIRVYN